MLPVARGDFVVSRDHWWWREGWGPGTRYLTWHLTFKGSAELYDAARRFAAAVTDVDHVDPVPVRWLHLTMSGVGPAGWVPDRLVDRMVAEIGAEASALDIRPLVFDALHVYREGVLLATDAEWLRRLRAIQVAAIGRVGGVSPAPGQAFRPHVSLAYFSGEVDEQALGSAIEQAALEPVTVAHPTLSLLQLGRDDRVYTWRTLADIPLVC